MFETEAELAAFLAKREEILYNRLLLNRTFAGTVTEVQGSAPQWQVRVTRDGEVQSDNQWHKAAVPGYTPQLGDKVDLTWRDDNVAHVQAPLSSGAFVAQGATRLAAPIVFTTSPATVSFSSIPQSFTHLFGTWRTRSSSGTATQLSLRANNDSSGSYDYAAMNFFLSGATPGAFGATAQTSFRVGFAPVSAGPLTSGWFYVLDYARTDNRRQFIWYGWRNDSGGAGNEQGVGTWNNLTTGVNALTFSTAAGTLETGVFSLYGI